MSDQPNMTWEQAVNWLKTRPEHDRLVKACFYDDPLEASARRYHTSAEWQAVREILSGRSGSALDIGAGRGISSYALARDGWDVSALEPDESMNVGAGAIRRLCEESGLTIRVVQEWGETLPFDDNSFDLVYCRAVLHHARDLGALCAEAARVLRPGGMFLATREHVLSKATDLDAFLKSHPLHALYGGEHAYLLGDYLNAIETAGLSVIKQLNPTESDINLHPASRADLKARWARKLRLPFPELIPDFALDLRGRYLQEPGRLYSFVATKDL